MDKINKKNDSYSLKSSNELKTIINKEIKKVFVECLKCIEIKFGDKFDGYDQIRKTILRIGNDSIRDLSEKIDKSYNIERIPDIFTIKFNN